MDICALLPDPDHLAVNQVQFRPKTIWIEVRSTAQSSLCPTCDRAEGADIQGGKLGVSFNDIPFQPGTEGHFQVGSAFPQSDGSEGGPPGLHEVPLSQIAFSRQSCGLG